MAKNNNFKKFLLFNLGLIPVFIFINFVKPVLDIEFKTATVTVQRQEISENLKSYSNEFIFIQKFVKNLEDNKIDEAITQVSSIETEDINQDLKDFFKIFYDYYSTKKSKNRDFAPILNDIWIIKKICNLELNDSFMATQYAETILFFCIKNFEQHNKNKDLLAKYCTQYIEFIEETNGYMSKELAAIMCLNIRTYYEIEGIVKNDEKILNVQNLITKYQQRYPEMLGENPKDGYEENCNYLKRFYELCDNIRNKHFFDKIDRFFFNKEISLLEV